MNIFFKLWVLLRTLKWRLLWNCRNTRYRYTIKGNPKFMGPREAVDLIEDGAVCMVPGLAGNQRITIMAWAIREVFQESGHPRNLTLISPGGQGGRGQAPGTLEELGHEGLVTRFFSGHQETYRSLMQLAEKGKIEVQCIPQGMLILLVEAQSRGEESIVFSTGVGTFCDPRVGGGSALFDPKAENFIEAQGDKLCYRLPKIDVAIFNAPAADSEGNIYIDDCSTFCATKELALAAKRNGGKVIASVGRITDKRENDILVPADKVDAVVYYPRTEQTVTFWHKAPSPFFVTNSKADTNTGVEMVRFMNRIFGITPRRSEADYAVARMAAKQISRQLKRGSLVNIGTGMPEEVFYIFHKQGMLKDITAFTEAGAVGGVPAPGIFFGAAITPTEIVSSPEIFKRTYRHLDATVLGFLQVDSVGNVNVSKRGEGPMGYVGPGGFIDFTCAAQNIFFIGSWMSRGKMEVKNGEVKLAKHGKPKFVDSVDQITFNGAEALKAGKKVFYFTNIGTFELTSEGMHLINLMPGIDVEQDILEFSPMKMVIPNDLPVFDLSLLCAKDLQLGWKSD